MIICCIQNQGAKTMPSIIPESHRDLLDRPIIAAFSTIMPDGHPQVTPVWCSYDGTHVIVNATPDRQKHKNVLRDPRVTIMAVDPMNNSVISKFAALSKKLQPKGAANP